jgi:DNA-binding transcriptional LysR family regulator
MRPMALRVQVRSFEAVCRAVEAKLGIGVLPLAAARGFSEALKLKVEPLQDDWATRAMQLVTRSAAKADTPLAALVGHLQALAD